MALDWKKLFSDKATYPDTTIIKIGDQDVTIGDLRQHNEASNGETLKTLTDRDTELKTREEKTARAQQRLADIMEAVAKTTGLSFDQIIAGDSAAAVRAAAAIREQAAREGIHKTGAGEVEWESDPIYAPVDKRLKPIEATQSQIQGALRAGLTVMQNDRTRLDWIQFRLDHPDLAKGLKYEDAVKLAVDKGYKDDVGFPDVGKALTEMAAPGVSKSERDAEYKRGREEGAAEARRELMGSTGLPAGGGTAGMELLPAPDKNAGKVASIAEQLNKAMTDPDILRGITGPVQ